MAIADLDPPFGSGQRPSRYQPIRRLAVGGMAELVLACTIGPGDFRKVVALKRLLPQHALDPQLMRMFLDEARLMARMSHPNIPQVYDVCDVDDNFFGLDCRPAPRIPYFVMEYVHGTDLRSVMNEAEQPLPIAQVVALGAAVAAGLHYAHEMRAENGDALDVVHRDVSPSNVLISFGGNVKVTDFGVAKWNQQSSLTQQGQLKGKFAHMSPEQCRGQPLDRRSDIFALGTLLYEMAAGQPAFKADGDFELMSQIVSQDVRAPKSPGGADLPPGLVDIILRALKRSREDRYPTAQAVQLDLERFARDHRIVISSLGTAEYLETLFGARVSKWRDALNSGQTLAEHLLDGGKSSTPMREPTGIRINEPAEDGGHMRRGATTQPPTVERTLTEPPTSNWGGTSKPPPPPSVVLQPSRGENRQPNRKTEGIAGVAGVAGVAGIAIVVLLSTGAMPANQNASLRVSRRPAVSRIDGSPAAIARAGGGAESAGVHGVARQPAPPAAVADGRPTGGTLMRSRRRRTGEPPVRKPSLAATEAPGGGAERQSAARRAAEAGRGMTSRTPAPGAAFVKDAEPAEAPQLLKVWDPDSPVPP